jgi:hypothetical protein
MASIQKMEERTARAMSVHEKTAQRLAALKAQYERESRKLQEHKDKLNLAWVRGFASQAEKEGIQIGRLDVDQLVALVKENLDVLALEPEPEQVNDESKESPASAETEERKEREVSL